MQLVKRGWELRSESLYESSVNSLAPVKQGWELRSESLYESFVNSLAPVNSWETRVCIIWSKRTNSHQLFSKFEPVQTTLTDKTPSFAGKHIEQSNFQRYVKSDFRFNPFLSVKILKKITYEKTTVFHLNFGKEISSTEVPLSEVPTVTSYPLS